MQKGLKKKEIVNEPTINRVIDFKIEMLSPATISPNEDIIFEFSYRVLENNLKTHIAFSFIDVDTNIGVYNDNSWDNMQDGIGIKKLIYKCKLSYFNRAKLKLIARVRDENQNDLAISSGKIHTSLFWKEGFL